MYMVLWFAVIFLARFSTMRGLFAATDIANQVPDFFGEGTIT